MRFRKTVAAFGLLIALAVTTPSFAAADRDAGRAKEPIGPIERVIQLVKRIVKPLDSVSIPKP